MLEVRGGAGRVSLMPSSTVEDYLKAMLRLEEAQGRGPVTVGAIAEDLGLTPGSVSVMMRHLSAQGWVAYSPRRSVALLAEGRKEALRVVRRHRLIEAFLVQVLKLDWSEVHEEAEILEHAVSDRLLARMDEMLGHPSHDPHGDPIPDARGRMARGAARPLSGVAAGHYRVVRVGDAEPEFLDWLRQHGLRPGSELDLKTRDAVAGITEIVAWPVGRPVRLGDQVAERILVEPAGNP